MWACVKERIKGAMYPNKFWSSVGYTYAHNRSDFKTEKQNGCCVLLFSTLRGHRQDASVGFL